MFLKCYAKICQSFVLTKQLIVSHSNVRPLPLGCCLSIAIMSDFPDQEVVQIGWIDAAATAHVCKQCVSDDNVAELKPCTIFYFKATHVSSKKAQFL